MLPFLLAACEAEAEGDFVASAAASGFVPSVVTVSWESPEPGVSFVEYGLDGAFDLTTPEDAGGSAHSVVLLGLKAGRRYGWRAVTVTDSGERHTSADASITIDHAPREIVQVSISDWDEDRAQPGGFVLTSLITGGVSYAAILDRDGDYVWWHAAHDGLTIPSTRFNLLNQSVLYCQDDKNQVEDLASVMRVPLDGSEPVETRTYRQHHDFLQLPDGDIAWLSLDVREIEVEGVTELVVADTIVEGAEGSTDETAFTEVFNFFDDYPFSVPCSHFYAEVYGTGGYDWTHANSILYDEPNDAYWMMTKNLDALHHVDRKTGVQLGQIGGVLGDYTGGAADEMWRHGHMSHLWEGGFAVFDNGYHGDPDRSRVVAYQADHVAKTISPAFAWEDPEERFVPLLGDIRRTGSTWMTSWSSVGTLAELADDGTVVWKATLDVGGGFGRATWVRDLYSLSEEGER